MNQPSWAPAELAARFTKTGAQTVLGAPGCLIHNQVRYFQRPLNLIATNLKI